MGTISYVCSIVPIYAIGGICYLVCIGPILNPRDPTTLFIHYLLSGYSFSHF